MIVQTSIPELGHVAYFTEAVYCDVDVAHGLDYQRRAGLLRLAHVLEDQLGLGEDAALLLAAELVAVDEAEA